MAVKVVSAYYLSMLLVIIGHDLDTDRLNAATSNQHNVVWYNVGTKTETRVIIEKEKSPAAAAARDRFCNLLITGPTLPLSSNIPYQTVLHLYE